MTSRKKDKSKYDWRGNLRQSSPPPRVQLYRISEEGKIAGICAGLADYFGIDVTIVRIGWFLALFPFWWLMITAYVGLWVFLRPRPRELYRDEAEEEFWSDVKRKPKITIANLHLRFRKLEHRLQAMESEVTSAQYRFDQELKRGK